MSPLKLIAVALLASAAACATPVEQPPGVPILDVNRVDCDAQVQWGSAAALTPPKPRKWNDLSIQVTNASPCLIVDGRTAYYVVYKVPENGPNHVFTVGGQQEPHRTLSPFVVMLDESGAPIRTFEPSRYMVIGNTFGIQFRPAQAERYLLVRTDAERVGKTRGGVEQRVHTGQGAVATPTGSASYTTVTGSESVASRTFSHEGTVQVHVRAIEGNIGDPIGTAP